MHGVEIQDNYAKMGVNSQCVQHLCLEGDNCSTCTCTCICIHVWAFCRWCIHAWSCCCRGFVEAYRDLLELICEACNVTFGSQACGLCLCTCIYNVHVVMGKFPAHIPKHLASYIHVWVCYSVKVSCGDQNCEVV